jgi:AmmeMemoRadiSam system protein A
MTNTSLTNDEKQLLLKLARQSIELAVSHQLLPVLILSGYSPTLREPGAAFVTLTEESELRGCIGALEPYQPLVEDVREHAVAAALEDYRFPPVRPDEVKLLEIEVSRLTLAQPLDYQTGQELIKKLHPAVDGVILRDGMRRATFLPQVWEKIPNPAEFLSQLCLKMGAPHDLWQRKKLQVFTYQVDDFHE